MSDLHSLRHSPRHGLPQADLSGSKQGALHELWATGVYKILPLSLLYVIGENFPLPKHLIISEKIRLLGTHMPPFHCCRTC